MCCGLCVVCLVVRRVVCCVLCVVCLVVLCVVLCVVCVRGRMREVDVGSGRALLIKEHGEFSAIAHKCPHYGAPLVKGTASELRS